MSFDEIAGLTPHQLAMELNISDEPSADEEYARNREQGFEVFDQICERYVITPEQLAQRPAHQLAELVHAVIGKTVDGSLVQSQAHQYEAEKSIQ